MLYLPCVHYYWILQSILLLNSQNSKESYNKKILGERIARLCGAIAVIQVPYIVLIDEVKHLRGTKKSIRVPKIVFLVSMSGWCSNNH